MGTDTQVDDRGRITLPQKLRDELGLKPGTRVHTERVEHGILVRAVISEKEFIAGFEGCVDSRRVRGAAIDPLQIKRMWEPFHDRDRL